MSHSADIHFAQTLILRELLFCKEAGFSELKEPTKLSSDNFAFHIKKCVELGFVEKTSSGKYALTAKGKEHANKLDTDRNTIERQPKVAVILTIERERSGKQEYLFQQRLKHPYFEYWGCPTGKIGWGESIIETAERELMEETGLTAKHRHAGVYHERVYGKESKQLLEDKIFHVVHCTNTSGELVERFEGGKNEWMELERAKNMPKTFESFELEIQMVQDDVAFVENKVFVDEDSF